MGSDEILRYLQVTVVGGVVQWNVAFVVLPVGRTMVYINQLDSYVFPSAVSG